MEGCLSALVRGQGIRTCRYSRPAHHHRYPISTQVRGQGIRTCRYSGKAKNHLQALLIGTAVNLVRAAAWLAGKRYHPKRQGLQLGLAQT